MPPRHAVAESVAAGAARAGIVRRLFFSFVLGAVTVLGFAPFYFFLVPILTLAFLLGLVERASSVRDRFLTGFAYGLGFFICGVSWVYVSLHDFGSMSPPLAALSTLLLCAYLALFPGAATFATGLAGTTLASRALLVFPAAWTVTEWARGWIFTGFPWLALGYSQAPDSPLTGFAPLLGVYGVSLLAAQSAGLLVYAWHNRQGARVTFWFGILAAIWIGGSILLTRNWTMEAGEPVSVSLIQGNIPQELKWRPDQVERTLETYLRLVRSTDSRLIVLPETALPLYLQQVPPDYLDALAAHARTRHGDVLIGLPEFGRSRDEYYNSVLSFGASPLQTYRKHHLVPFGEFVPLQPLFGWFVEAVAIPLLDFSRGDARQRPLDAGGQKVAVNICYEDLFGEEIIRQLPEATLLVNASNVAWFGESLAPAQHLQISQMRALETGRVMLRATNTGMTAVIDSKGQVQAMAPPFTEAVVRAEVHGRTGATFYVRVGNFATLALAILLLAAAFLIDRRHR